MDALLTGDKGSPPGAYHGYLEASSAPMTCFFFTLPLFLVYHGGLWWINGFSDVRWANAADIAIAGTLGRLGIAGPLLSFLFVIVAFLVIQSFSGKPWRWPGMATYFLMVVESCVFSLPVFMLSRLVARILDSVPLSGVNGGGAAIPWQTSMILSCGAGVYEEFLFRLVLMGGMALVLDKVFGVRGAFKYVVAAIIQALLFSSSHHLPGGPEAIRSVADMRSALPVFAFRTVAGLYFAFLYIERGFGIAAGAHAVYDLLVVGLDMLAPGVDAT